LFGFIAYLIGFYVDILLNILGNMTAKDHSYA